MIVLPVTLTAAAGAAIINFWLSARVGTVRRAAGISIGDGGHEHLTRRMRAQLNFAENTPLVLMLVAALELARGTDAVLLAIAGLFLVARVLHGVGMDGGRLGWARSVGTVVTMLTSLGLAGWAVALVWGL